MPSTHFLTTEGFAMFKILITSLVISLGSAATLVAAQTAAPIRLRATIEKVEPGSITVKERSGEVVTLQLAPNLVVTEVFPIDIADIKAGSYIGTAAMPQADGTLKALEVLVFPETMRGVGEGHRPFDLQPQSTMTNATVDQLVASSDGKTLKLKYKDGEKTLTVAADAPIVTFKPGDNSLLVVGAKLIVTAELRDGKPTALRIVAGKNGFAPPM
jgi:hypothetical protein